ncbi:MAG TPA: PAS domain S-box protein [Gaiellaceae bacterium]|nr:PAS domain S-box protein [Gaiellaceae bacterium]
MPLSAPPAGRPPRLVLRFAVYSAFALTLAWLAIFWVVRTAEVNHGIREAQAITERMALRTTSFLRQSDFARPVSAERRRELDELFGYELGAELVRVKLWSRDGVVTYSDDDSLIGDRATEPHELRSALRGEPVQEVASLNQEGGSGRDLKTLESWVPVRLTPKAEPVGALETFQDYGPVAAGIRETVTPIGLALAVTLALLYAALLPILRKVTRALESRHRRLEEHAAALSRALEERREAEQRLSQAERNYRTLVEQLPLVTYIDRLDETSSSIYISPQVEQLLGYSPLQWMSDPEFFVEVLHPDDRERVLSVHRTAYAEGASFAADYRLVAADGRVVWVHDEVMVVRDESGRPLHAQGFMLDVTERKHAQEALERSHTEVSALHETALLLMEELDVEKLLERVAVRAGELVGTADTYVYLRDGEELRVAVGTGTFAATVGQRLRRGEGLAGRVWETGEPLTVDDYTSWTGRHPHFESLPFHGVTGVPLRSRKDVVGVLGVARLDEGGSFDEKDVALLARFAHLASLALESARLYAAAKEELQERRRAEEALGEAELRYRTLVENLPLATYISPLDSAVGNLYVSPQVEDLLGYPAQEWVRDPQLLLEAVHPDDLDRLLADAERLRATGEALRAEYRYRAADGRTVWLLDQTALVRDERGTPLWVQGFLLDITERKTAEESRARLAAIVESSDDAIMSASIDLRITSWNAAAERMFGYAAEEAVGRPITLLMPPDRAEKALGLVQDVIAQRKVVHVETVRAREDGRPVDIAFTYSPILDPAGEVVGVSAIGQDITKRKRAEAAIRESEAKFRSFVETTEEWVWAAGRDNVQTYSNPAVERLLGWTPAELEGRDWCDFVLEEDRDEVAAGIEAATREKSGWSGLVIRWRHKDGSVRFMESNATPILDERGELAGWRGTDRDVTHRIQAEAERERLLAAEQEARAAAEAAQRDLAAQNERLRELDRLKDEFIALVSHELRTPLTSIRGYTELLLDGEGGALSDDQRQFLGVVERNAHRLLHLVGDLLFLAQVEAGKLVLDVGALDVGTVAAESVEAARPQAEGKGIVLTLATDPVPPIAGDRARIAQLLDNLVSNAVKFTPAGGRVDVRVRTLGDRAVLEVRDSGIGIPADERSHLFQRFYRTSRATRQAIQGTGLGLAISKAIADAHEGRITVESEEDVGTTFRVELPLREQAELPVRTSVAL